MKKLLLLGIVFYGSDLVACVGHKMKKAHRMGGEKKLKSRKGGGDYMPKQGGMVRGRIIKVQKQVMPGMP